MATNELKTPKIIKKIREARGLTLEQVAGKMGTTRQYLSIVETGKINKPLELCNAMAEALSITNTEATELRNALLEDYRSLIRF